MIGRYYMKDLGLGVKGLDKTCHGYWANSCDGEKVGTMMVIRKFDWKCLKKLKVILGVYVG